MSVMKHLMTQNSQQDKYGTIIECQSYLSAIKDNIVDTVRQESCLVLTVIFTKRKYRHEVLQLN